MSVTNYISKAKGKFNTMKKNVYAHRQKSELKRLETLKEKRQMEEGMSSIYKKQRAEEIRIERAQGINKENTPIARGQKKIAKFQQKLGAVTGTKDQNKYKLGGGPQWGATGDGPNWSSLGSPTMKDVDKERQSRWTSTKKKR